MRDDTVTITQSDIDKIVMNAYDAYPEECCGLMFSGHTKDVTIDASYEMVSSEGSNDHFVMDPLELAKKENEYSQRGYEIMGFYHSHPEGGAYPSREDEEYMIPNMVYLIVSLKHGRCSGITAWIKDDLYKAPIQLKVCGRV